MPSTTMRAGFAQVAVTDIAPHALDHPSRHRAPEANRHPRTVTQPSRTETWGSPTPAAAARDGGRAAPSAGSSSTRTQVTFDCIDPHAQVVFWAQVFSSTVEDHSVLMDKLVAYGLMPAEDRVVIDGRSAFRDVAASSDPTGTEPRLFFQRAPEGKPALPRTTVGQR
jgi:hypothetical protein